MASNLFLNECKAIIQLQHVKAKIKIKTRRQSLRIYAKQNLLYAYQKAYFDVKKKLQFEGGQKLWKKVKDGTEKCEEAITELERKDQIRKSKQIFH